MIVENRVQFITKRASLKDSQTECKEEELLTKDKKIY